MALADSVVLGIGAAIGSFAAGLTMLPTIRRHLRDLYRRLGRIEGKMSITPKPIPEDIADELDRTNPGIKRP